MTSSHVILIMPDYAFESGTHFISINNKTVSVHQVKKLQPPGSVRSRPNSPWGDWLLFLSGGDIRLHLPGTLSVQQILSRLKMTNDQVLVTLQNDHKSIRVWIMSTGLLGVLQDKATHPSLMQNPLWQSKQYFSMTIIGSLYCNKWLLKNQIPVQCPYEITFTFFP